MATISDDDALSLSSLTTAINEVENKTTAYQELANKTKLTPTCGYVKWNPKRGYEQCDAPVDNRLLSFCKDKHRKDFEQVHGGVGRWLYSWVTDYVIKKDNEFVYKEYLEAFQPYFFLAIASAKPQKSAFRKFSSVQQCVGYELCKEQPLLNMLNFYERVKVDFHKFMTVTVPPHWREPDFVFERILKLVDDTYLPSLRPLKLDNVRITYLIECPPKPILETETKTDNETETDNEPEAEPVLEVD